ncbi:hypothetical protein [Antribacter gilvus]|nr:hypothetical protein [Antribacter gilvus]
MTICHVWPGITPRGVWDLTFNEWVLFARAADEWQAQQEKSAAQAK